MFETLSSLQVAIKSIKKEKIKDEQDMVHIRREIEIMSSIRHPHIISIYEGIYLSIYCLSSVYLLINPLKLTMNKTYISNES